MAIALEVLPNQLTSTILEQISGQQIREGLDKLAKYGGSLLPNGQVAVSRLAFSEPELAARKFLTSEMFQAGMRVDQHPFGLIGNYPGQTNEAPVDMVSHFDSVPNGGIYDGALGIKTATLIVDLLNQQHARLKRPLRVVAFTNEESSRFQRALLGSTAMYFGLTEEQLIAHRPHDITLKQALEKAGFGGEDVSKPYFGVAAPLPAAALELHISQDQRLERAGYDLEVVKEIAAPDRFQVKLGYPLTFETVSPLGARYLKLDIQGRADHSGATQMGEVHRKDGLVFWSELLLRYSRQHPEALANLAIGFVKVKDQALNKIPGEVQALLRFSGASANELTTSFQNLATSYGNSLKLIHKLAEVPINCGEIPRERATEPFYSPALMLDRQLFAAKTVQIVRQVAERYAAEKIVGTVGTFDVNDGQLLLGVDIRGIDVKIRDLVTGAIKFQIKSQNSQSGAAEFVKISSSQPTVLDSKIARLAKYEIDLYHIGSSVHGESASGHDVQKAAEKGIPAGLIFVPSRAGGISHNPAEYSTTLDLARGAKALAAVVFSLGNS